MKKNNNNNNKNVFLLAFYLSIYRKEEASSF